MLWKCCTQYASNGKLSSGHRTGKGPFSFQSLRKDMPKNIQTAAQLHSSLMLAKQCPKFSKPGFPVHQWLPESAQTHVHLVSDATQPSPPLSSPSPPALNLSQHQGFFLMSQYFASGGHSVDAYLITNSSEECSRSDHTLLEQLL